MNAHPPFPDQARALQALLRPSSIALVGASSDARSFGGFVLGNLLRFGYAGALHLVSRSSTEIQGLACVDSIQALPDTLDLAVLAIPEAGVLEALHTLAAKGCRAAVLFASGYAEAGEAGRLKQNALAELARDSGMLLLGPNCMGFTNYRDAVPLTFEALAPQPQCASGQPGIGVLAQSGAMAANLRDAFLGRGLVVPCVCSTGNEASVTVEDVLAHYLADAQIRVIALYAEQIRRPALFLQLARQARLAGKPIVLLMPGRSARAREAAASHTGALAGDHASATALLRREAVVIVESVDELYDTTAVLLRHPQPPAGGTAFVTGSGAMKNLALDFADDIGLELPALAASTTAALAALLPDYAVAENPLDYTTIGVRQPGLIGELIHTMLADGAIGNAVLAIPVGPEVAQRDKAEHIVPALARATKPAVLVLTGDAGPIQPFFTEAIQASGLPLFRSPDRALRALRRVAQYGEALQRAQRADAVAATDAAPARALPLPGPVPADGVLAEYQGKAWLRAMGLATPAGALAQDVDQALDIADDIGWPVVLKAQAGALPHKSDAGGVIVGLGDAAALRAGWATLRANLARHRPGLLLDGVLVEAMGPRGIELIVGARRDPDWGPVLMVGLGGVWIEALKDVRLLPANLAEADIVVELQRLKAAPVLRGLRGQAGADLQAVARVVAALGAQMRAQPRIAEVDINPLLAYPDRVLALDALLCLRTD
ncbi:MAG: acetate--CoA ligase family protein [Burkholderiaceae bacterium]|nr:acetate--CoA ligase family protein [Burkholderiaceae bacterium]